MPTILCDSCETATTLPASWSKPSFMCPHCMATVRLDAMPDPAPASKTVVYVQPPAPPEQPSGSAFGTMFGGAMGGALGCLAAVVVAVIFLVVSCTALKRN